MYSKKKLDTQLLLDQELIELEKRVQIKQNKTTTINKRLIKSKKSFQSDKKKLYQCKKNLTTWQFKLRKIKLRNSDKKFPIQSIENLITKIFKERLQAKITVTMEKMFDIENSCIKKEDQIDQEAFNFKICEKDQIKCEKELLNQYDEKIKIQKLLLELENKLQIHQKKLDEASNQLQRVIQEASSNDKMRTNIKYYLKKDKNHELTESDYYYLNQI